MLSSTYTYNKHLLFWACCAGLLLFGVALVTLGTLALDLRLAFGLDGLSAGSLYSVMPLGILAGSLLFGPVSDRFGYKMLLTLASLGLFAGFRGIAGAGSLWELKAGVFCFGLAGGVMNGATNAVVSDISARGKGASLSLLGVAFGIGALAMPQVMGELKKFYHWRDILSGVGALTLGLAAMFALLRFPPPKQTTGFPLLQSRKLLSDLTLLLIGGFLFFQSSFESIINNWTTAYLTTGHALEEREALYGLSLHVAGLTVMRLLAGSVFRNVPPKQMLAVSLLLIPAGLLLLKTGGGFFPAAAGLVLLGAGLAGGFPIMLGYVGERYAAMSGTAFSIVLAIALIGNMLVNLLMGWLVQEMGVQILTTATLVEWGAMLVLGVAIVKRLE